MFFLNLPPRLRLWAAGAITRRNPHSAIALVMLQVANQRREISSEIFSTNREAIIRRITSTKRLTVDLNITPRLNASETSYTPERANLKTIIIVAPTVNNKHGKYAIYLVS